MNVLVYLVPASLLLGGLGLAAFLWMVRTDQFDDPDGQANRILSDRWDDRPAPPPAVDEEDRNPLDEPPERP